MSDHDDDADSGSWGGVFRRLGAFYSFGSPSLQPMTAYGRMDARLKEGDSNFQRDGEEISEELVAALKRVAIVSRR